MTENEINEVIKNINELLESGNIVTGNRTLVYEKISDLTLRWRVDGVSENHEAYTVDIDSEEDAIKIVNAFTDEPDIISKLKSVYDYSLDENLYLHLFIYTK